MVKTPARWVYTPGKGFIFWFRSSQAFPTLSNPFQNGQSINPSLICSCAVQYLPTQSNMFISSAIYSYSVQYIDIQPNSIHTQSSLFLPSSIHTQFDTTYPVQYISTPTQFLHTHSKIFIPSPVYNDTVK
jgi:hypothetical protein